MELKQTLVTARIAHQIYADEVLPCEAERQKVIRGESSLNADLLNKLYSKAKEKAEQAAAEVSRIEERIKNNAWLQGELAQRDDSIMSWAQLC